MPDAASVGYKPKKNKENSDNRFGQDKSNRFPVDDLLRSKGFSILQRKKGKPNVWQRGRQKYDEDIALKHYCTEDEIQNALYAGELYFEGVDNIHKLNDKEIGS